MKILLVCNGPEFGTSSNLFRHLARELGHCGDVRLQRNDGGVGPVLQRVIRLVRANIQRIPAVIWCDCIIVHSCTSLSCLTLLVAWLLRRRVIAFCWDVYPTTIAGQRVARGLSAIAQTLEAAHLRLVDKVIVPSEDFLPFVRHPNIKVMPLWPSLEERPCRVLTDRSPREGRRQRVQLAFAGQAGPARGLDALLLILSRFQDVKFDLHMWGPSRPAVDASYGGDVVRVFYHGNVSRSRLAEVLIQMDFGVISLHPLLDQPAFPSKLFDYVAADLPVLYSGPSIPRFEMMLNLMQIGVRVDGYDVLWERVASQVASDWMHAKRAFYDYTELSGEKCADILA